MSERVKRACAVMLLIVLAVGLGAAVTCVGQSASDADSVRADTLYQEGETAHSAAQYSQAIPSFEQALVLCRTIGDGWYEAASLFYLGYCHYSLDDYRKTIDCCEQALAVLLQGSWRTR